MSVDLERLAADTRRLLDIEEIKQLKYRYIRLADAQRFEEWGRACFTDDCYLSTLELGGWQGRDTIVQAVTRCFATAFTIHQVHMPEIVFTGPDSATGIWALSDYVTWVAEGKREISWGRGQYEETYVRTGEGWRISRSVFKRQALPPPTGGMALPQDPLEPGARSNDDQGA